MISFSVSLQLVHHCSKGSGNIYLGFFLTHISFTLSRKDLRQQPFGSLSSNPDISEDL